MPPKKKIEFGRWEAGSIYWSKLWGKLDEDKRERDKQSAAGQKDPPKGSHTEMWEEFSKANPIEAAAAEAREGRPAPAAAPTTPRKRTRQQAGLLTPGTTPSKAPPKTPGGTKTSVKEHFAQFLTPPSTKKRPRNASPETEQPEEAGDHDMTDATPKRPVDPPVVPEAQEPAEKETKAFRLKEPAYLETYEHVRQKLGDLFGAKVYDDVKQREDFESGLTYDFADSHFKFAAFSQDKEEVLARLCKTMPEEAALVINYVADGGPKGADGWVEVFTQPIERMALVCAIIGLVLQEHVFSSLCYGAPAGKLMHMHEDIDYKHRDHPDDGFSRAHRRCARIVDIMNASPAELHGLPAAFVPTTRRLAWQLFALLEPILLLDAAYTPSAAPAAGKELYGEADDEYNGLAKAVSDVRQLALVSQLYAIVAKAGLLSLQMRLDPATVYHMTGAFKEEGYDREEMHLLNEVDMRAKNPASKENAPEYDGSEESEVRMAAAERALALVRMTVAPGWSAYKRGGWMEGEKGKGIRVKELTRPWACARWGDRRVWCKASEAREIIKEAKRAKDGDGDGGEGDELAEGVDDDEDVLLVAEGEDWEDWIVTWAKRQDKSVVKRILGFFR